MVPTDRDPTTNNATTATIDTPVTISTNSAGIKCPECGNAKISRTRREGVDRIISLLNIYPYSCRTHTCKARFYRFGKIDN